METVVLYRCWHSSNGTFGVMKYKGRPLCVTLELQWYRNIKNISCIPEGEYSCVPHTSQKYKNVWRLENVPERSGILIHAGNTSVDTTGCILVGHGFAEFKGIPGVSASQDTLDRLRRTLPKSFQLHIRDPL